jgi:hypothetical protein
MAVHMLYQDGLAEGRAVMDARAPIGVAACAYFEVEGTIYLCLIEKKMGGREKPALERRQHETGHIMPISCCK